MLAGFTYSCSVPKSSLCSQSSVARVLQEYLTLEYTDTDGNLSIFFLAPPIVPLVDPCFFFPLYKVGGYQRLVPHLFHSTHSHSPRRRCRCRCRRMRGNLPVRRESSRAVIGNGGDVFFWGGRAYWTTKARQQVIPTTQSEPHSPPPKKKPFRFLHRCPDSAPP